MRSFLAYLVLRRSAVGYMRRKRSFSKTEITKQINEIKYLSAQKKVPQITLRKQVNQLETKLKEIVHLEKSVLEREEREERRLSLLKKENSELKRRIALAGNKDLQEKVDKLSHLLASVLAKKASAEEVALAKQLIQQEKIVKTPGEIKPIISNVPTPTKINIIEQKLVALKHDLEVQKTLNIGEEKVEIMERQIKAVENRLTEIKQGKVKHTLILEPKLSKETVIGLEKQLPLPPPPND